ncbi:MAG: hypothetical protein QMD10_11510 [Desulfitobacteriaceae bacterium]|nr:hypothetical protein [Desulfitobacteriaceae bacterium]
MFKLFYEDIREKKTTARGVRGRASRTGKVSPSQIAFPGEQLDGRTREGKAYKGAGKVITRRFNVETYLATGQVVYID